MSRLFDHDVIVYDEGTLDAVLGGGFTIAVLFKRSGSTTDGTQFLVSLDGGVNSNQRGAVSISTVSAMQLTVGGITRTFGFTISDNVWYLFVVKKAAGTATPRANIYNYDTAAWVGWANGSDTLDNDGTTLVEVRHGNGPGDFPLNGKMGGAVVYTTALSDGDGETLADSAQSWFTLGPAAMWRLNQFSELTSVPDDTGNGADQTAITGTVADTADDPDGFSYALADTESLFTTQTPTNGNEDEGVAVNTSTTLFFAVAGNVTHGRFFAPTTVAGATFTAQLYQVTSDDDPSDTGTGTLLASEEYVGVVGGAWNTVAFDTPVAVVVDTLYRIQVHASNGRFVFTANFFSAAGLTNGNISAPQSGTDPVGLGTVRNGTYKDGATAYANTVSGAPSFFVDVVFTEAAEGVTGILVATLPAITGDLDGVATATGDANITLPAVAGAFTGVATVDGDVNLVLPAVTSDLDGTVTAAGVINSTLTSVVGAFTGTLGVAGGVNVTLPPIIGELDGVISSDGVVGVTLPAATLDLDGVTSLGGVLAVALPTAASELNGTVSQPVSGTFDVTLPGANASLAGTSEALPPTPGVDLMTLAFGIVTGIGQCVVDELEDTEGGVPDRVCLAVPGAIAWDNCECGQFAQTITTDAPTVNFPAPASDQRNTACGPALLVVTAQASITRCVPTLRDSGEAPSCDALFVAARVLEEDRRALRTAITCCLWELRRTYRITDFAVGVTTAVGPEGMCAGVEITYQFGINGVCC